jgi:hypothetical protein
MRLGKTKGPSPFFEVMALCFELELRISAGYITPRASAG